MGKFAILTLTLLFSVVLSAGLTFAGSSDFWLQCGTVSCPANNPPTCTKTMGKNTYYCCPISSWSTASDCAAATVTFLQTGLSLDSSGTVLTVDGINYIYSDLPLSFTWPTGSSHTFSWSSPVSSTVAGKRYAWTSTSGLSTSQADTLTVPAGGGTVTGNYETQYQITFSQTGILPDSIGTVLTVDGTDYTRTGLPVSFWWPTGSSHTFSWSSPVSSVSLVCVFDLVDCFTGTQYLWTSTSGLSTSQADTLTVPAGGGTVTGNYKAQHRLLMRVSPPGSGTTNPAVGEYWYDSGTSLSISATPDVPANAFLSWSAKGAGSYFGPANPASITMNGPIAEFANIDCPECGPPPPPPPPPPSCVLLSASITNCAGGTCEPGETVSMSASFSGTCTSDANTYFQIDAKSADGLCDLQFSGGDLSGITSINPTISGTTYTGTWTVPPIAPDCSGRTIYAYASRIWSGQPGIGTPLSTGIQDAVITDSSPVAGSLVFSSASQTCSYSLALQPIANFDTATKTGTYTDSEYTWVLKATDSSTAGCPSTITYTLPLASIVTTGSCDVATGVYNKASTPPAGIKVTSFTIARGAVSADVLKAYVKRSGNSCTLSFGINDPNQNVADPIFTVSAPPPPGSCNNNGVCEVGETQDSCPDCRTLVTLTPNQILPGQSMTIKIDMTDGRYVKNQKIKYNLFIDGTSWNTALCPISNVDINPTSPPPSVAIVSDNIQAIGQAVCRVPNGLKIGAHTLRVIPSLI